MSCLPEFFSCFRPRKGDGIRGSAGEKSLIRPLGFLTRTSNTGTSLPPPTGESNSHFLPLPQLPQLAYTVERGIVYPPDARGSPANVDYFSDETYSILMKNREESSAAGAALCSENCTASWSKFTEIREMSESGADWGTPNDSTGLELLPKICTGAMSPIRIPSPSLRASVFPGDPEPGRSFLSLIEEYDPSPVKYTASFGKSGTYREATLSLFTERGDVNREKKQGVTEKIGSLNSRTLCPRKASLGTLKSETVGNIKACERSNSDERVSNDHVSEAAANMSLASDIYDEKKTADSSGNTIGIALRGEEDSAPQKKPHTVPNDRASSPESRINFDSSINFSHLRALVEPSESNLTSSESLLSYGLNSSSLRRENFYTPSEIGVLEESATLLSSVQDYVPSLPIGSSIYSSEHTSTPSFAGMDGCYRDASGLVLPSGTLDQKAPDQTQNPHPKPGTGLRKKISPGPVFYPPAGRTRPLDVATICSIYPDRFPHSLQKLRRVTDHDISERHLDNNAKASESSKNVQVQPRRSSYGAVTTRVGGGYSASTDAWHKEQDSQSGVGALRTVSHGLNPEFFPGIEGPPNASPSKDDSKAILAVPTNQLTFAGRLKSSISLGDRLRGHGRSDRDAGARRRASTNSLRNRTTTDTENIDENNDTKNGVPGRRLKMVHSLSRLKNKMHPISGLKYEINTKLPVSTAVYHLSSYNSGGAFKDKDKGRCLESDSRNEMEEEMKCSKGTGEASEGNLETGAENGPKELASDSSSNKAPIIEANPESAPTSYEDCVMLPFSFASFQTLAEPRSQEKLVTQFPSPGNLDGYRGNRLEGPQDV